MNPLKKVLTLSILALAVAACGTTATTATMQEANVLIDEAKAAYKKVLPTGFAWRDTESMIKSAEKALEGGDYDRAAREARKAKHQSVAAYQQYEDNKNAHMTELN